jgi:hypothetical protein
MTMEEIMAPVELPPPGHYRAIYEGLLKDEDGGIFFPTMKGGQSVKARFRLISPDPVQNGRGVIYQGVLGQFSFANLQKVVPIVQNGKVDDEAGVNTEIEFDLAHQKVTRDGEERTYLRFSKMRVAQ